MNMSLDRILVMFGGEFSTVVRLLKLWLLSVSSSAFAQNRQTAAQEWSCMMECLFGIR